MSNGGDSHCHAGIVTVVKSLPSGLSGKEPASQCRRHNRRGFDPSVLLPGIGNGKLLQYACLDNPMVRGAWWVTVHKVTKSWT